MDEKAVARVADEIEALSDGGWLEVESDMAMEWVIALRGALIEPAKTVKPTRRSIPHV